MSDAAASLTTMEFHPQPQPGDARPWAFPAPERGSLDNGLTVLRCHRPGQQVVAVEIVLDAPLDAGFDIYSSAGSGVNAGYAVTGARLFAVNLLTGKASSKGVFPKSRQVVDLAIPLRQG